MSVRVSDVIEMLCRCGPDERTPDRRTGEHEHGAESGSAPRGDAEAIYLRACVACAGSGDEVEGVACGHCDGSGWTRPWIREQPSRED